MSSRFFTPSSFNLAATARPRSGSRSILDMSPRYVLRDPAAAGSRNVPRLTVSVTRVLCTLTTVPRELIALARSLRETEPRLPHLACVASHRAVAYADRNAGGETDPIVAAERYSTRSSLAASLRKTQRARDAVVVA